MKEARMMAVAVMILGSSLAPHQSYAGSTHGAPLAETITEAADEVIPNLPGKRLVSHIVDYPPGASSAALSANANDTDPARLLPPLIVNVGDEQLVIPGSPSKNRTEGHESCRSA